MNAQSIDEIIDNLYIVRNKICAYLGTKRDHMCDCKYHVNPEHGLSGEAGSGCPELLDTIAFLIRLRQELPNTARKIIESLHPKPSNKLVAKHEDDPEEHEVWCDCDHCMYMMQDLHCRKDPCEYCDSKRYYNCPSNL